MTINLPRIAAGLALCLAGCSALNQPEPPVVGEAARCQAVEPYVQ